MISSMTGYGRGEARTKRLIATTEVRSVNSRLLEVNTRLPSSISNREADIKDIVRSAISRGKVNVAVSMERTAGEETPLRVNTAAAKAYYKLLNDLRKTLKLKDKVSLVDLMRFSEIFEPAEQDESQDEEWRVAKKALDEALRQFNDMRKKEGESLMNDLSGRVNRLGEIIDRVERLSREQIPVQRVRLEKRLEEILQDRAAVDSNRVELEIALLVDKLDVTEECVRFRSHNQLFLDSLVNGDAAGRKLNFLIQEMNREANTIGSKASDAEISHLAVAMKEEIEKIREQLQNIE
jgi:uncharacterized protein (TIGR00255 family)